MLQPQPQLCVQHWGQLQTAPGALMAAPLSAPPPTHGAACVTQHKTNKAPSSLPCPRCHHHPVLFPYTPTTTNHNNHNNHNNNQQLLPLHPPTSSWLADSHSLLPSASESGDSAVLKERTPAAYLLLLLYDLLTSGVGVDTPPEEKLGSALPHVALVAAALAAATAASEAFLVAVVALAELLMAAAGAAGSPGRLRPSLLLLLGAAPLPPGGFSSSAGGAVAALIVLELPALLRPLRFKPSPAPPRPLTGWAATAALHVLCAVAAAAFAHAISSAEGSGSSGMLCMASTNRCSMFTFSSAAASAILLLLC